jgi:hypothetical protein
VKEANRVQALTIATTILVSTFFLSNVNGTPERPLSTGVPKTDLMLFFDGFSQRARTGDVKHAENRARRFI